MDKKKFNAWIMYHEINRLNRLGFSANKIARHLKANWRTVKKYLSMTEREYEEFLMSQEKAKKLEPYEGFVRDLLNEFQDTSAAQMFDWLKEHHDNLPIVSDKTVYNFVMGIRQKYGIPIVKSSREYFLVEELPYGQQAQVDFGQYSMRSFGNSRKKVYFFAIVLARSRMKYLYFWDRPFTSNDVCLAHEKSFEYFGGIPQIIVYDQDRTLIVDENLGDIILTEVFRAYTKSRNFVRHFCKKEDPESKGKVENLIGYIKKNFLYNRKYHDCDTLNRQAVEWLHRTANHNVHNFTKKSPSEEFVIEKQYLTPYKPIHVEPQGMAVYQVRKTNNISYKSNFYSLPEGTFTGRDTQVLVMEKDGRIDIFTPQKTLICSHGLSIEKGKTIINTNHRRDRSQGIEDMMETISQYFTNNEKAICYFKQIQSDMPRYIRDHLQVIKRALKDVPANIADGTLDFCVKNTNYNAHDFESVLFVLKGTQPVVTTNQDIKLLDGANLAKANETPQMADIKGYEDIINN